MSQREEFEKWHKEKHWRIWLPWKSVNMTPPEDTLHRDWETWQTSQAAQAEEIERLQALIVTQADTAYAALNAKDQRIAELEQALQRAVDAIEKYAVKNTDWELAADISEVRKALEGKP